MALEYLNGLMDQFMKGIGKMIELMALENLYMQMETFMKVIGKMIKQMVLENIIKKMVLFSKVIGKTINNTAKELKYGEHKLNMKATLFLAKKKAKVN
jgi:hypothetical protein